MSVILSSVKSKKVFWVCILVLLIVCGVWATFKIYEIDREGKKLGKKIYGIEKLPEIEKAFKNNPTIDNGVILLEKYVFLIKDYDRAVIYGESCINLGVNETSAGWLVNLWMAKVYSEKGNLHFARNYLGKAFELDYDNLIKENNSIENLGIQQVLDSLKERQGQPDVRK